MFFMLGLPMLDIAERFGSWDSCGAVSNSCVTRFFIFIIIGSS